ncbi:MAG: acetyl-CoA carboxylase carboxyl transferase subunit alpha [Clostridia bacterium]|nr:acetyl-CoA carboxylase carboxyl transferase subunit alpha [Clostridia bacterium]
MDEKEKNMQAYIPQADNIEISAAWKKVQTARMQNRPQSRDYINALCQDFFEVKGDRCLGDDDAIVTGIGRINETVFTIIGQQKGITIEEKKACSFGMANPEGYRKSMRAIRQAEKFNRPILTLIDTPGAFCGIKAEEKGQGTVIAEHLQLIASAKVPVIAVVLGEGGSGGALALALSDKLALLENSYFSVISPEGCASILFKDSSKAQLAAESLCLTPDDLIKFGIADDIIKEKPGYSRENMAYTVYKVKQKIKEYIDELSSYSGEDLVKRRYEKLLNMKGFNN